MMMHTVHVAVYDSLADWEVGYATAHINRPSFHRTPGTFEVRTVGATLDPVRTAGGMRLVPDVTLDEVTAETSAMLVLPGNDIWDTDEFVPFAAKARELLAARVPVAAICGATGGLARQGLFDDRPHTSNAKAYLDGVVGYAGGAHYRDEPVVVDGPLITAGSTYPVEFARAVLDVLGVYEPDVLESWYKLYGRHDPAGFYELMQAQ